VKCKSKTVEMGEVVDRRFIYRTFQILESELVFEF